jgi:hypothetical protein
MGQHYLLIPSVYGQMGRGTIIDHTVRPPVVRCLHFVLDRPPGDDLHKSSPCFMVSDRLGRHIADAALSGAEMGEVQAELDEQYLTSHPGAPAPRVSWLKVHGRARADDFGLDEHGRLVVSEKAMQVLRQHHLEDCRVYDGDQPPTPEQVSADTLSRVRQFAAQARRERNTGGGPGQPPR